MPDLGGATFLAGNDNDENHTLRPLASYQAPNTPRPDIVSTRAENMDTEKATDIEQNGAHQSSLPDGGYGWICVLCQLLITANTWGINGVS